MLIRCNNCGGTFEDTNTKCPYCEMIYEPGAEKAYMGKLESIRGNLDEVDEIVVTDFKSDMKRSLIVFGISFFICMVLFGAIFGIIAGSRNKEKKEILSKYYEELDEIASLNKMTTEWDNLYENGEYEKMCESVKSAVLGSASDVGFWKHYGFYMTYSDYLKGMEHVQSTKDCNGVISTYDLSNTLQSLLNMYVDLYVNDYSNFSLDDRELLAGAYEDLKKEALDVYQISEEEYEDIKIRLTDDDRKTYIGSSDCDEVANERLGK